MKKETIRLIYNGGYSEKKKVHFTDYLTGLEPSGEHIEYWPMSFFNHQQIELDKFRQDCEVIDNE